MRNWQVGAVVCALSMSVGSAMAQAQKPRMTKAAQSVPGTEYTCGTSAPSCPITVRVEPDGTGCKATVDVQQTKVKKDKPVNFLLVRGSMQDTATYQFVDQGIVWTGSTPPTDEFSFVGLTTQNTVAQWKTGSKKSQGLGYLPNVKRADGTVCGSGDPLIINEG